jgi:hypothetical protein
MSPRAKRQEPERREKHTCQTSIHEGKFWILRNYQNPGLPFKGPCLIWGQIDFVFRNDCPKNEEDGVFLKGLCLKRIFEQAKVVLILKLLRRYAFVLVESALGFVNGGGALASKGFDSIFVTGRSG